MKNGKKMIEMFPDATKEQRVKKLWKEYEEENDFGTSLMVITAVLIAFAIVLILILIFEKYDFHPITGYVTIAICAWGGIVLNLKNWFKTIKRWFYGK